MIGSTLKSYNPNRIIVSNIHFRSTVDDLFAIFRPFGTITEMRLMLNERNESKGYAFITYARQADSVIAIREMNGFRIFGREIKVGWPNSDYKVSNIEMV